MEKVIRSVFLLCGLFCGIGSVAFGQALFPQSHHHQNEAALMYQRVHTNAQTGECGCFGLNGIAGGMAVGVSPHLSLVAEGGVVHAGNVKFGDSFPLKTSLTLVNLHVGARYWLPLVRKYSAYPLQPFAQVLIGGTHAGGGEAGAGDHSWGFSTRAGVGFDLMLSHHMSARVQAGYFPAFFSNGVNAHQNNLLFATGLVYHWMRGL